MDLDNEELKATKNNTVDDMEDLKNQIVNNLDFDEFIILYGKLTEEIYPLFEKAKSTNKLKAGIMFRLSKIIDKFTRLRLWD